jgi:hypothetical protein
MVACVIIRRTYHGEVHKTKKKTIEEEQKGLALLWQLLQGTHAQLAHTSSYQFFPCSTGWGRQPTSQQPGRGCIGAGMRIPVKLQWEYMWSYRWLKVIDKEILALR